MLAAGIVQDTFAGEAGEGKGGGRGDDWRLLLLLLLVLLPLLNFIRKTLTRAWVLETDICIYIYIYLELP